MGAQCFKPATKVERISERALALGEAPHWDERVQALYLVSVLENSILKYDPATNVLTTTKLEGRPGFIVPLDGHSDQFVVGLEREFVVMQWDGTDGSPAKVLRVLAEVDLLQNINRINDGKADPRGRIYAGTMGYEDTRFDVPNENGTLYRLDSRGVMAVASKVSISNGLCWDLRAKAMYYIDTPERKIRRYDYDAETGNISNLKYIFDFETHKQAGAPDGCTVDTDGNLWVAVFGGGCVLHISPTGQLLRRVEIPVKQVTSCTFGGANLDILFVTTGRLDLGGGEPEFPSGCTFRVTGLGVQGHLNVNAKL